MNKKNIRAPFRWTAKVFSFNGHLITDYNILEYREEDIKRLKKKYPDKAAFSEALRLTLLSQYWSRAEWELIIAKTADGRIILSPWCGCADPDAASVDVTDDSTFDWSGFAEFHIAKQVFKDRAKIDVYDQIVYRWDDFLDFVWNYHHKYQRSK